MKITVRELVIVLNQLIMDGIKEITVYSFIRGQALCTINLTNQTITKIVSKSSWNSFLHYAQGEYKLSQEAMNELPTYSDITRAFVASGIIQPEGIEELKIKILEQPNSSEKTTPKLRTTIALDTNQLIFNTMSAFLKPAFSNDLKEDPKVKLAFAVSFWVLWEKSNFLSTESNSGIRELREKFRISGFNLKQKVDKKARLGYSIITELKALEPHLKIIPERNEELAINSQKVKEDKDLRDEAIVTEYEAFIKEESSRVIFVSSDMQTIALSQGRLEEIQTIIVPLSVEENITSSIEQLAELLYQLTLIFGRLSFDVYNISTNLWFSQKNMNDWETKRFVFSCSDKDFWKKVEPAIQLVRHYNQIFPLQSEKDTV
jgi:hypothetical protein